MNAILITALRSNRAVYSRQIVFCLALLCRGNPGAPAWQVHSPSDGVETRVDMAKSHFKFAVD